MQRARVTNLETVRAFIASWNGKGVDLDSVVSQYLAEDAIVRFLQDLPPVAGSAAIAKLWKGFRANGETVTSQMHSDYARGPLVVLHRTDIQLIPGKPDRSFEVVGTFFLKDGKIQEWTDYMIS